MQPPPQRNRKPNASTPIHMAAIVLAGLFSACATAPELTTSGFLSDYSKLEEVDEQRMRYESPAFYTYNAFVLDPVQIMVDSGVFTPDQRAEVARHFGDAFERAILDGGLRVTDEPGVGVARVRIALTDVAQSTWWKKIHPATRAIGAGTGGAAMETEVIDSVTGDQVAAMVRVGAGNQFDLTNFTTVDDVKSAIDGWSRDVAERLSERRERP